MRHRRLVATGAAAALLALGLAAPALTDDVSTSEVAAQGAAVDAPAAPDPTPFCESTVPPVEANGTVYAVDTGSGTLTVDPGDGTGTFSVNVPAEATITADGNDTATLSDVQTGQTIELGYLLCGDNLDQQVATALVTKTAA